MYLQETHGPNKRILSENDLLPYFIESFSSWTPTEGDIIKLSNEKKITLDQIGKEGIQDFHSILNKCIDGNQIDFALGNACDDLKTIYFESELGAKIGLKQLSFQQPQRKTFVKIDLSIQIEQIEIPDPTKDELQIVAYIITGCNIDTILDFCSELKLIEITEKKSLKDKWKSSEEKIGDDEKEKIMLSKILGVEIENKITSIVTDDPSYTIDKNEVIWRSHTVLTNIKCKLDFSKYPFDFSQEELLFMHSYSNFSASEVIHIPYTGDLYDGSFLVDETAVPRGFKVICNENDIMGVTRYCGDNFYIQSELYLTFKLIRKSDTVLWRTIIPTMVVFIFGFIATLFSIITGKYCDSVMNQVLPAILIASVAMQLTSSQMMPPQSGRTFIDVLFILSYGCILFLYLSLIFIFSPLLLWVFFSASFSLIAYGVSLFFRRFLKSKQT